MLEFLTGAGLAVSAGLNAYIPLLALGLAGRFLDVVTLPAGWVWLENPWVLGILGALLVIELVADKIPIVDSFNDWLQTIVRPTAGGLAFGSGSTASTVAVADPASFFANNQWVPIALGALIALIVHLTKATARPVINVATVGVATPVVSAAEDVGSVAVSVLAILMPILIIAVIVLAAWAVWWVIRRRQRRNGRPRDGSAVSNRT
ncbi:hypothetical protein BKA04_000138 [Cryobacterium mesophilum]|uniref:DUF4126 domain-containing protein n=1 Tax=Terrimesophilobacter mesophilus TaxID=433647 RepID=A0A4R8V6T9_9MICO|nr:DUF4126 domain-containing protein [Terrimesophilobacter mesophilus]MBB5631915.1 hypothetical protein [Terrimesophilobacter mesophilus]TFB78821.1 DUF4126 domain-containing protein [Terrimesophilobacter mesophilus]